MRKKGTRKYKSYRLCSNAAKDKRQRQNAWMLHRESPLSRLFWLFISFLAKWAAAHSLVLFSLTLGHIIATLVGLDFMTRILKKFIDLCDQTTDQQRKTWVHLKSMRALVDSNRSINLPFNMRKILCTYPRKRKYIRGLQMFQIGDLLSFLAGGLTCIRRGGLFVSWLGCREDQTP